MLIQPYYNAPCVFAYRFGDLWLIDFFLLMSCGGLILQFSWLSVRWLVGPLLCRLLGPESLMTISAVGVFLTILATTAIIPQHARKPPEPQNPDNSRAADEPEYNANIPEDSFGFAVRGSKVWKTMVALGVYIPCFFLGLEGSFPFGAELPSVWGVGSDAFSMSVNILVFIATACGVVCAPLVFLITCFLPISLAGDLGRQPADSREPPLLRRLSSLGWVVGLVILVVLNDSGVVEFPNIVVIYLTLLCFVSVYTVHLNAGDKWAAVSNQQRLEQARREIGNEVEQLIANGASVSDIDERYDSLEERVSKAKRVPEKDLCFWATLGGWPGAMTAQRFWRHKVSENKIEYRKELASGIFAHCFFVCAVLWGTAGLYSGWF